MPIFLETTFVRVQTFDFLQQHFKICEEDHLRRTRSIPLTGGDALDAAQLVLGEFGAGLFEELSFRSAETPLISITGAV